MTTKELKKVLIHRIGEIQDKSLLEELQTIVETKTGSSILVLTDEQRADILESKTDVAQGYYTSQQQMDAKFEIWANAL